MNLLLIYTDEQRADAISQLGHPQISTPNLDALAKESQVFERCYATQPVCTPSRASLHTGLYPHATGATDNNLPLDSDLRCLPEWLSCGKHATGHIGKWHLGDEIFAQHGFDEWISTEDLYAKHYSDGRDRHETSDYLKFLVEQGYPPNANRSTVACMPEGLTKAGFMGDKACDFIERHQSHPFALAVSFLEPHMPFFGPRNTQYKPEACPLPGNYEAIPDERSHLKKRLWHAALREQGYGNVINHLGEPVPAHQLRDTSDWRRLQANYYGLISMVDHQVGRILEKLSACDLDQDTLVVFTSDHGDMMGSHQLLTKGLPYEESVRVPLFIRVPGKAAGTVPHAVSLVDLLPTMLDLMGESVPDGLHGASLKPYIDGQVPKNIADVLIQWNGNASPISVENAIKAFPEPIEQEQVEQAFSDPVRTIISQDGWKLSMSPHGLGNELYNLNEDPGEWVNLYHTTAGQSMVPSLYDRLAKRMKAVNDSVALPCLN
ncbi:sulfatase-like hydrolase/transferase [Coraliomargarita sp. SDUM461004]|uniref:Sulfatase-like hydrolase/transferase n=1 Tax=Thalassobacterium sedimentorum TaxID=3041258 RepID=A0ABU1ADZ6_9BACT|nr:sulfatase-like hydrolase/transferase [Coraliomargarita sp. SDUM461004]MDQ8192824.1 sulfatase-like hydrolase/transferase [Coraliomargarita sp. SDUM461004]